MPPTLTHGKTCHLELPATDVEAAASYERVFGRQIRRQAGGPVTCDDPTRSQRAMGPGRRPAQPGM
jgi:hypothetical protein